MPSFEYSLEFSQSSSLSSSLSSLYHRHLTHYHIPKLLKLFFQIRENNHLRHCKDESQIKWLDLIFDPEIFSFKILQTLIVKGFQIDCDFFIYVIDRRGQSCSRSLKLLPIENDQDLIEVINHSSFPKLHFIIDLVDFTGLLKMSLDQQQQKSQPPRKKDKKNDNKSESMSGILKQKVLSEWDIVTSSDIILAQTLSKTNNFILNQIEKLRNKAKNLDLPAKTSVITNSWLLAEAIYQYIVTDDSRQEPIADIWPFLDPDGRVKSQRDFRVAIYRRGMDTTLRRIGWKHLLNVYPEDYTGQQRIDFIRLRCETYKQMRDLWQRNSKSDPEVINVCNMVRKDVLRTDRHHQFYQSQLDNVEDEEMGPMNDDSDQSQNCHTNPNVTSLFNILVTYALNHKYRYCQGMSDLVSPLLYVMKDESHAYLTFCALMQRLGENFSTDGNAINRKFHNLKHLLGHYDPQFYNYLCHENADDLLFCYRWILLDLKREFPFDDVLELLEVLWASIPPPINSSVNLMNLFDSNYLYVPNRNNSLASANENQTSGSNLKSEEISAKPSTLSTAINSIKSKPNLHLNTKVSPQTSKTESQKSIFINFLDSPMIEDVNNKWTEQNNKKLPQEPLRVPHVWDSPNFHSKDKRKFDFEDPTAATSSSQSFINVDHSRFFIDTNCDYSSMSPSSGSSSSYYGDDDDVMANCKTDKTTNMTEIKQNDNISTCSTFDSGIQRSNTITSCPDDLTFNNNRKCEENNDRNDSKINKRNTNPKIDHHNRHNLIAHCNGDCSDEEPEMISNISLDHGYLTDYCTSSDKNQSNSQKSEISQSVSVPNKTNNYQTLPRAKQLLEFLDDISMDSRSSSSKTITSTGSSSNGVIKQQAVAINEQFNNLSAKSVSEEMLNSAIKQMETLNVTVDPMQRSNHSGSSLSSIEFLPGPDELLSLESKESTAEEEQFPLIPPEQLRSNDAFMLFCCLTLLLQHRDYIMEKNMDRNEIQMYFDGMIRKHSVRAVLDDARHLFHCYLAEWRRQDV